MKKQRWMKELQHLPSLCLYFDNIPFSCALWAWVGIKIWFCFWTPHTNQTKNSRLHNSIWRIYFHYWKQLAFHRKMSYEDYIVLSLSFCKPFYFLQYHTLCTKLCLCGGGYGCTNSIWSEKNEDSVYLALGSSSFQIWKDLLIYSDILQKDWARLVCR